MKENKKIEEKIRFIAIRVSLVRECLKDVLNDSAYLSYASMDDWSKPCKIELKLMEERREILMRSWNDLGDNLKSLIKLINSNKSKEVKRHGKQR